MKSRGTRGIHHVTAIAGDPQANIDFYAGVLGLRLVKLTVNFDDPGTYHLYYGDGVGRPGTILTFFPWPGAQPGRMGAGQTSATAFAVPRGSLDFWAGRLRTHGVAADRVERFGAPVLAFHDGDQMALEIVESDASGEWQSWPDSPVPAEQSIRGFDSVTLLQAHDEATAELLTGTLGFTRSGKEGSRSRFETEDGGYGTRVDIVTDPAAVRGRVAVGSVHHVAWRAEDAGRQLQMQSDLVSGGQHVTEVIDRQYFKSIYFREPGGVLFEIATDQPGFLVDEPFETLGSELRLPPQYEPMREKLVQSLPPVRLPQVAGVPRG
jgi:glyoxalase family protein